MTTPESRPQPSHEQASQRNASSTRDTASKGSVASEPSDAKRPAGNAQLDPSEQSQRRDMRGDPRNGPEGSYRGSAAAGGDEGRAPLLPSDAGEPEGLATTLQAESPDEHARRTPSAGADELEEDEDVRALAERDSEAAQTLDALVDPTKPDEERARTNAADEIEGRSAPKNAAAVESTAEPAELAAPARPRSETPHAR
jgi:hypothetical protein